MRRVIDLLSNSATVGSDTHCSADCFWTFFRLAKQATNKLAESLSNSENVDYFHIVSKLYFLYKVEKRFLSCSWNSCFLPGFLLQIYAVRNFLYVTGMVLVEGVKCPSFHTQFLDCFECVSSTLHFCTFQCERTLRTSALKILSV